MIVRYQHPYAAFRQLDSEFERLVRLSFGRRATEFSPAADVFTEGTDAVITVAIPGISAEDVSVTLEGRRLSIAAERKERESAEGDRYLVRGLSAGTFRREFTLPQGITAEQVGAEVAEGLLTVRVTDAVKPAPQPQQIPVKGTPPVIEAE